MLLLIKDGGVGNKLVNQPCGNDLCFGPSAAAFSLPYALLADLLLCRLYIQSRSDQGVVFHRDLMFFSRQSYGEH